MILLQRMQYAPIYGPGTASYSTVLDSPAESQRQSPVHSQMQSQRQSPAQSPGQSQTQIPAQQNYRQSQQQSPTQSPLQSQKQSPAQSPRQSPVQSRSQSPNQSPRQSDASFRRPHSIPEEQCCASEIPISQQVFGMPGPGIATAMQTSRPQVRPNPNTTEMYTDTASLPPSRKISGSMQTTPKAKG